MIIQILLCVIWLLTCHRQLGLLLSKSEHGTFNVRNDLSACCVHGSETGTDDSASIDSEQMGVEIGGRGGRRGSFTQSRLGVEARPLDLRFSTLSPFLTGECLFANLAEGIRRT